MALSWNEYVMITVEQSVVIDRPPELVFAMLASFGNRTSWNTEVVEETQSPPGSTPQAGERGLTRTHVKYICSGLFHR